jgi:hypothetical protein
MHRLTQAASTTSKHASSVGHHAHAKAVPLFNSSSTSIGQIAACQAQSETAPGWVVQQQAQHERQKRTGTDEIDSVYPKRFLVRPPGRIVPHRKLTEKYSGL